MCTYMHLRSYYADICLVFSYVISAGSLEYPSIIFMPWCSRMIAHLGDYYADICLVFLYAISARWLESPNNTT